MNYTQIVMSIIVACVLTAVATPILIPILRKIKAGQSIREEGPQSHYVKSGTPTMGGIAIIFAVIISSFSFGGFNSDLVIIVIAFFAYGLLGFLDDYVKVSKKRNLGLTAKQKMLLQVLIAAGLAYYQSLSGTEVFIPFFNNMIDFGMVYIPFVIFVIVAMVNSVNLTDGLDGLASGVTLIVALFLAIIGSLKGFNETSVFCAAMAGACLGFLIFNKYPAKVFMGDTGSLALGGGIAAAAIMMNMELIIPIAGGIFVAEALSVILQVGSFKIRKKRIFKMAPIHHHFELCGLKETKVVTLFWATTLILCLISFLIIYA